MVFSKQAVIITILWIVGITIFVLYLWPNYKEIKSLSDEKNGVQEELTKEEEFSVKAEDLLKRKEELKNEIEKVQIAIPVSTDSAALIVQTTALVSESGLILNRFDLNDATSSNNEKQNYKTLPVSLMVKGTYNSFKALLDALENNLRFMDISLITFEMPKKVEDLIEFKISFNTYYQ